MKHMQIRLSDIRVDQLGFKLSLGVGVAAFVGYR